MMFTFALSWPVMAMAVGFILICLLLILVILIQKPKGGGLSGAFGGSGGSAQAAFGAKTGDVLTWGTVFLFVAFLLLAMGLTWTIRPAHDRPQNNTANTSPLEQAVKQIADGAAIPDAPAGGQTTDDTPGETPITDNAAGQAAPQAPAE